MMVLYICLEYKQWEGMLESSKINIVPFMTSKFHIEIRLLLSHLPKAIEIKAIALYLTLTAMDFFDKYLLINRRLGQK